MLPILLKPPNSPLPPDMQNKTYKSQSLLIRTSHMASPLLHTSPHHLQFLGQAKQAPALWPLPVLSSLLQIQFLHQNITSFRSLSELSL